MRVVGVDPGLASIGLGFVESRGSRLVHLGHHLVTTSPDDDPATRLLGISREVQRICGDYAPEVAAVEALYFAKNISSAIPVAQARGAIIVALAQRGIPVHDYSPPQIKQAIVGTGGASKHQIGELVALLLGLGALRPDEHAADALACAICHLHAVGGGVPV